MAFTKKKIAVVVVASLAVLVLALVWLPGHWGAIFPGHSQAAPDLKVVVERIANGDATADFKFKTIPGPARTSAATFATFSVVAGGQGVNGARVEKLPHFLLPDSPDAPGANFFFRDGSDGGRILVDLNRTVGIQQINTYSWHKSDRGPQLYKLYASDGAPDGTSLESHGSSDLLAAGWKLLATVDTRPKSGEPGGQYGVSITSPSGLIGNYRYLLFECQRTEEKDLWGNTFYSQIDVIAK